VDDNKLALNKPTTTANSEEGEKSRPTTTTTSLEPPTATKTTSRNTQELDTPRCDKNPMPLEPNDNFPRTEAKARWKPDKRGEKSQSANEEQFENCKQE